MSEEAQKKKVAPMPAPEKQGVGIIRKGLDEARTATTRELKKKK